MEYEKRFGATGEFNDRDIENDKHTGEKGDTHRETEDLLPEFCDYRDEGCAMAESCLECPYQQCVFEPGGRHIWLKRLRDREIIKLYGREKRSVEELAVMFGLSQRTVRRALKNIRNKIPKYRRK